MDNNESKDPKTAIQLMVPRTKSSKIKSMYPEIEERIKAGVSLVQIVEVLKDSGLDISIATLKSYLYRLRKSSTPQVTQTPFSTLPPTTTTSKTQWNESNPIGTEMDGFRSSINLDSVHSLDSLINPDPAQQAEDLAKYERLAKLNRRKS